MDRRIKSELFQNQNIPTLKIDELLTSVIPRFHGERTEDGDLNWLGDKSEILLDYCDDLQE